MAINRRASALQIIGKVESEDREIWRVSAHGQIKNITTSASSTTVMDEAIEIYANALKRLANR